MKQFNAGILGYGVICRTYVADIQAFYPRLSIIACTDVRAEAARKLAEESAEGSAWRHAGKCAMMETTSEPENRTMKLEQENPYEFIADKEHTCTRVMRPG